jgi:hypothetical protein
MACNDLSVQDEGAVYRLEEKGIVGDQSDGCKTCGSGLARDGAGTCNIRVECKTAIASRLAPTMESA